MKEIPYVVIVLVILTVIPFALVQQNAAEPLDYQKTTDEIMAERIENKIAALKKLSLQESLQHLSKMEYYHRPGAFIGGETIFFLSADGRIVDDSRYERDLIDSKKIMSNRVFRQCYQKLQALPKNQAAKIINSDFSAPATEYDFLVRSKMRRAAPDKEYIYLRYFEQATDDDLKELCRLARSR
ncbi:MAG: hypothetical protein LBT89_01845 [Planctomycetaceae bacterium]|jgi:hypothetical protein|nr:hypothetical protein [Planctomycetaceae bacterium]